MAASHSMNSLNSFKDSSNLNYNYSTLLRSNFSSIPQGEEQAMYGQNNVINGFGIKALNVKCDVYTCDLSIRVQYFNVSDTTLRITGHYTAAQLCNKLKTDILALVPQLTNFDITYSDITGKFTITGGLNSINNARLTFLDSKSLYYLGLHIGATAPYQFDILASIGGGTTYTLTSSVPAALSVFPPTLYLQSIEYASADNYGTSTICVFSDSRITDPDYHFKWITIKNENGGLNYIKTQSYKSSHQFNLLYENVNTDRLEPFIADFQLNYEVI